MTEPTDMNGAESLVRTLIAGGVDVCFTNPGTSEMHFVAALDKVPGMRCILGLFEGVLTGSETEILAQEIEKAGANILTTGIGWHESRIPTIAHMVPRGGWRHAAQRIKNMELSTAVKRAVMRGLGPVGRRLRRSSSHRT